MSLIRCASQIKLHVKSWNLHEIAKESSESWLMNHLGENLGIPKLISSVNDGDSKSQEWKLSLPQRCELFEQRSVFSTMSHQEQRHLHASMGASQLWVNVLPLSWTNSNLEPSEWLVSARRRLMLDVRPIKSRCPSCQFQLIGKKGDHAITCHGGYSTSLGHHAVRNLIGRACRRAGFEVDYEHSGGLTDGRRPGDVRVKRWRPWLNFTPP